MTFYQELQLSAAGSKQEIRNAKTKKEKLYHIAVFLFKIVITLVFCIGVIAIFSLFCGDENRMVGVLSVLCILLFRSVHLDIRLSHAIFSITAIFVILTFGPRLANIAPLPVELVVHLVCIFGIAVLGCHNLATYNQSVLVLGYLLLYGYDVSGTAYLLRIAGMAAGAAFSILVYIHNHSRKHIQRSLNDNLREFNIHSTRTQWQIAMTVTVSSILVVTGLLGLPRTMWSGIAAMSVLVPFRKDVKKRALRRKLGNLAGGAVFVILYFIMPESLRSFIGIIGGVGTGLSAAYGWQAMFNSLGAMSMAVDQLDVHGAVFYRIFNNIFGALYALLLGLFFEWLAGRVVRSEQECE